MICWPIPSRPCEAGLHEPDEEARQRRGSSSRRSGSHIHDDSPGAWTRSRNRAPGWRHGLDGHARDLPERQGLSRVLRHGRAHDESMSRQAWTSVVDERPPHPRTERQSDDAVAGSTREERFRERRLRGRRGRKPLTPQRPPGMEGSRVRACGRGRPVRVDSGRRTEVPAHSARQPHPTAQPIPAASPDHGVGHSAVTDAAARTSVMSQRAAHR